MNGRDVFRITAGGLVALALGASATLAQGEDWRARAHEVGTGGYGTNDVAAEVDLGREVAARILGRYGLVDDASLTKYVTLVGSALARQASRTELVYHFAVLDLENANAYAAPGGYIFVTRGALAAMRDEAELAGVLAHEISHVTQRHIVKELNVRGTESGAAAGVARLVGGIGEAARLAFSQAVDGAVKILFERGYRIEDELEADRVAVLLLANTGYDPQALQRYLERLASSSTAPRGGQSATHPTPEARMSALRAAASETGLNAPENPSLKERFASHVKAR